MSQTMVQCSNCKRVMGTKPSTVTTHEISHGICIPCLPVVYSRDFSEEEIQKIVDGAKRKEKLGMHIPTIVISLLKYWFHNLTKRISLKST